MDPDFAIIEGQNDLPEDKSNLLEDFHHSIFGADTPDWTKIIANTDRKKKCETREPDVGLNPDSNSCETPDWINIAIKTEKDEDCDRKLKEEKSEGNVRTSGSSSQLPIPPDSKAFLSEKAYTQYLAMLKQSKMKCPNCFFTTSNRGNLKQHMKRHSGPLVNVYSCDLCNFTTKYKHSLKGHMSRHNRGKLDRRKK